MWPSLRFVEGVYRARMGPGSDDSYGGRIAVNVPFGLGARAEADRYRALVRQEELDARAVVEQQMEASLAALVVLDEFEERTADWRALEALAADAEGIARRWTDKRLADPDDVADLIDEAYAARMAVLGARERAGIAACTLLSMTGVPLEDWPRD
jgi:hypothetical protein